VRRNWFIAAIVIGVVAIVIAAIAMRVSDDNSSDQQSASAWADSVCSSLATWQASITAISDVSGGTPTADSVKQKLSDATTATQTLVDQLQALGPPELESGAALEQQLDSAATQIQSSFETLKKDAEDAADASSTADFIQGLVALAPQFQALLATVQTTVDDLQNANVAASSKAELQQAFADSSSCQDLRSEG
jgi:hypothetical protein